MKTLALILAVLISVGSLYYNIAQWAAAKLPMVTTDYRTLELQYGWPGSEPRTVALDCQAGHASVIPVVFTVMYGKGQPHTTAQLNGDGTWSVHPLWLLRYIYYSAGLSPRNLQTLLLLALPVLRLESFAHAAVVNQCEDIHFIPSDHK